MTVTPSMRLWRRPLIAWSSVLIAGCDPSLTGYDQKRPPDASVGDATVRDHDVPSSPPRKPDASQHPGSPEGGPRPMRLPDASRDAVSADALADGQSDGSTCTVGRKSTAAFTVDHADEIGLLERPAPVMSRDGAASGLLGQTPIWLFHETSVVFEGGAFFELLPATAARGDLTNPTKVMDEVDSREVPSSLFTLTPDEIADNAVDGQRVFLWANSLVADGATGYIFYAKGLIHNATAAFDYVGTGVARLQTGKLVATRDPALLFGKDERKYNLGGVVSGGYLYLYACESGAFTTPCYVARAPEGGWAERKKYTFWDGCAWTSDEKNAAAIIDDAANEITVSYNAYLKRYLAVYTTFWPPNDVMFRTAPRPEGPWSDAKLPVPFTQTRPDASLMSASYGAKEHPEFSSQSGKVILVSYPVNTGFYKNQIHLVSVTFH